MPVTARRVTAGARFLAGFVLPTALFYVLRALGVGLYASLLVSALVSAAPAVSSVVHERRVDGLSTYFTVMTLGAVGVSLVPGGSRFLLARESLMTGVTGVWFLASRWTDRPLAYLFCKPLLQGRLRWPDDWEHLWQASPRWRRMWRVSSALWGIGLLTDAAARVVAAYTLPPDSVPALGLALYAVTLVVLNVVTSVYYVASGVYDPRSPLRREGADRREVADRGVVVRARGSQREIARRGGPEVS
ncbi:intracellular septation protein A [Motilibacter peucedani]|uniref:Intracellular septation protein A n=1 Tax=Motilibacter peucedani TaxID=598650 RepID=A0A420XST4_9ACTN|nr:VC0807 family protein [Motilibacter peucedani]RKS79902.1 intracellular septation protein A [Motilibacter peucedani]